MQVTAFIAVPAMLADVVGGPPATTSEALTCVKRILVGAGAFSPALQAACQQRFPAASLVSAYGMTEACSSITFQALSLRPSWGGAAHVPPGACVGRPPLGIEIAVRGRPGAGATPSAALSAELSVHALRALAP